MEWRDVGQIVKERLSDLEPIRVLYEYDGPRIFICNDEYGDSLLAYLCDETSTGASFVVVPFNDEFEQKLTTGSITLLEALAQPRIWLATVDNNWNLEELRRLKLLQDLPGKKLPKPGAMLWPQLRPILAVKAIGSGDEFGGVLGSVVRETVERSEDALRQLLDAAQASIGTTIANLKRLYDLPAQRLAFGSFEISFRSPFSGDINADPEESKAAMTLYAKAGEILHEGIGIADRGQAPNNRTTQPEERQVVAVRAAQRLAASGRSVIDHFELSGRIVGSPNASPVRLGKRTHDNARKVLDGWKPKQPDGPMQFRGVIKQLKDSKPYQFLISTRDGSEILFETEDEALWKNVAGHIALHHEVIASGKSVPKTKKYAAIAVHIPS